ncbi:MAG: hypothetical protein AB1742_12765 [bacterium]
MIVTDPMVVIRVDGGTRIGTGNVTRCAHLARRLRDAHNLEVAFATKYAGFAEPLIGDEFPIVRIPRGGGIETETKILKRAFGGAVTRCLITDLGDTKERYMKAARRTCTLSAAVGDAGAGARHADLIFNGVISGLDNRATRLGRAVLYSGTGYILLGDNVRRARAGAGRVRKRVKNILITMGGSDPAGLTPRVVAALRGIRSDVKIEVAVGACFTAENEAETLKSAGGEIGVVRASGGLAEYIARSDAVVCCGGVTLAEAAAIGVPAVALAQTRYQSRAAAEFERRGACIFAGDGERHLEKRLLGAVALLINDHNLRVRMRGNARALVDAKGTSRVAGIIAARLSRQRTGRG